MAEQQALAICCAQKMPVSFIIDVFNLVSRFRYHKRCAWPLKTLWFDNANTATNAGNVHRKQGNILEVQIPDANAFASVKDNAKFVDSNKLTCADWREDCPSFDFYFSFYTRPDTLRIWKNCPKACNAQQGTVRMTVEAPPFEQHVDARLCDRWKQDCHHAADKAFSNGKLRSIEVCSTHIERQSWE
eukprot:m.543794 g.543794  ORF g.543794 m.543794 type:complete len:187 (+) comp22132_c0_seq4:2113-2673(+)